MKISFLSAICVASMLMGTAVSASTITSLVGDKDTLGYPGQSYPSGYPVADASDPAGFDVYTGEATTVRNWVHNFVLPDGEKIVSASLAIMTGELEDGGGVEGDATHDGADYDDTLTLDGVDYANAFDDVTTYSGLYPQLTTFDLTGWLDTLSDGVLNVTLNPRAGNKPDYIAVDWAELTIETVPDTDIGPAAVPLPASALLLLGGVGAIGGLRRRKKG